MAPFDRDYGFPPMTLYTGALIALTGYVCGATLLLLRLRLGAAGAIPARWPALTAMAGGLAGHTLLLNVTVVTREGLQLGVFGAASLISWVVVLILLLVSLRRPLENLGIIVLPIAALLVAIQPWAPAAQTVAEGGDWHLALHILLSTAAYSLIMLAVAQALLLYYQERALRRRQPGGVVRALPPLQSMETLLFQLIAGGFFLLSLALVSGLLFVQDLFAQHLVHKTVLSIAAWLTFAVLLWGHWRHGWRGRTAVRWTLGGGTFLILAYFGSKLVLEVLLQRSWG